MTESSKDPLVIAGVEYNSRLLVGTGKYKDMDEAEYKKLGFKYLLAEFLLLVLVGAFSGMANAVSF